MIRAIAWLESRPYWVAYYLVYLVAGTVLASVWQPGTLTEWTDVVTAAIGVAMTVTILAEGLGVLLIQPVLKKFREDNEKALQKALEEARGEAREEGIKEGYERAMREMKNGQEERR